MVSSLPTIPASLILNKSICQSNWLQDLYMHTLMSLITAVWLCPSSELLIFSIWWCFLRDNSHCYDQKQWRPDLKALGITVDPGSDSSSDRTNCISDDLDHPYCCIRQTLMEPFSFGQNEHYALKTESGVNSLTLRYRHVMTNGYQYFAI